MATKKATTKKLNTKKLVKKPMMKKGGIKKPLRKAQNGEPVGPPYSPTNLPPSQDTNIYEGPINERDVKLLNQEYPSTVGGKPYHTGGKSKKYGYITPETSEAYSRRNDENYLRSNAPDVQKYNKIQGETNSYPVTGSKTFKKGGAMKKYQDGGTKGRIKSKKVRTIDINRYGPSTASVSKTKNDGNTVTKKVVTSRGYVPTASMSKTVTDKEGKVISEKSKPIGYNKAVRKMTRIGNNVGRNENDTYSYKKGGAMKKMKTGGMVNPNAKLQAAKSAASKGVKSGINPRAAASKVARGRSGGTSTAPKTAVPKAKYGMSMKKK